MAPASHDAMRDAVRQGPALAVLGCLFVAGIASAAERELGRHEALRAVVPADFSCGEQAEVTVRAPDRAAFAGDRVALQKLVGG